MKRFFILIVFAILLSGCGDDKKADSVKENDSIQNDPLIGVKYDDDNGQSYTEYQSTNQSVSTVETSVSDDPIETYDNSMPETQSFEFQTTKEIPRNEGSVSQQNALRAAQSYLNYTHFSHDELIDQLEFDKYPHEDAVYAADNCGADWNEQALQAAKSYLNYTPFSYSGLISQLEFDKYTTEQANYAVNNCGADWMQQAVKAAKSYLNYSAFSHDGLVEQLEFDGYTHEQAEYGTSQNGL